MKYKRVLVAVDLSANSEPIIKKAKEVADETAATLFVVHVVEHSPIAYGGEFSIPINVDLEQAIETQAREMLQKLSQKIDLPKDRQYVLSGSVRLSVIDLAKELNIDLLVVGTYSHHGIDRLLGSRANAILHYAQCDVLAVRTEE